MRYKIFSWGCQIYSVALIVASGLVICGMLKFKLVVFGICECVLYMEIFEKALVPRIGTFAKSWTLADLNRTCCEF
jgi:hypothetical protein